LFHSDGKIDDAVEGLIDLGIKAINPLDPYGVDYREYKKRYGDRLCLWGNIDVEWPLAHGTPEDVEKDVAAHAEILKPGGRWIAGSSHSITNFVPHENYAAMLNAIQKYGIY
jgi:uroporphyrinogen decarboxylase